MKLPRMWRRIIARAAYGGRTARTRPFTTEAEYVRERGRWRGEDRATWLNRRVKRK